MQSRFCLPIIKKSKKEVLQMIGENQDYDFFEIWLDYIEDLDEAFVKKLIQTYDGKLLFLFRRQNLEPAKMEKSKRRKIIDLLNNTNILLDLDISVQKEDLEYINKNSLKIAKIVSFHNYRETPDNNTLDGIIEHILENNPDVIKISTMCNSDEDASRLMDILQKFKQEKRRYIVLGMGELGKKTRVYGLLQGNEMNFAPRTLDEQSAPGQFTKDQLVSISKCLL